jgi:Reverse transcriptase (RNA-dependent DNA polymerase)
VNPTYLQAVAKQCEAARRRETLSAKKKQFIVENVKLQVPEQYQQQYLKLLLQNHKAISQDKFDLGRTNNLMHEIAFKMSEPIHVKQFKIPDAHWKEVEQHILEWFKLGVIQLTHSCYNSPIFAVMKKDGTIRLVQDFRALNNKSYTDKYSMKDISECIGKVSRSGSTIFSTIDLTAGFWQMILYPKARPYTAFTVPGMGQFQWVTSRMGLLGCPASFQCLETVVKSISNVILYIDDLLVYSATHEEHLATLGQVIKRLVQHKIKINLQKCIFGSKEVSYLGFHLTEEGIKPSTDKLKAVKNAPLPPSVHEVRQLAFIIFSEAMFEILPNSHCCLEA